MVRLAKGANERFDDAKRYLLAALVLDPANPDLLRTAKRAFRHPRLGQFEDVFMRRYFIRNHRALAGPLVKKYRHLMRVADVEASVPCEIWLKEGPLSEPAARRHTVFLPAGYCMILCVPKPSGLVLSKSHDFTAEKRYHVRFRYGIIKPVSGSRVMIKFGKRTRKMSNAFAAPPGKYRATMIGEGGRRTEVEIDVMEGKVSEVTSE
jgi:hypothetical protein